MQYYFKAILKILRCLLKMMLFKEFVFLNVLQPAVASRPPIQKDEVQSIKRQSEAPRPMSPTEHDSEDDSDDSDDDDDVSSGKIL